MPQNCDCNCAPKPGLTLPINSLRLPGFGVAVDFDPTAILEVLADYPTREEAERSIADAVKDFPSREEVAEDIEEKTSGLAGKDEVDQKIREAIAELLESLQPAYELLEIRYLYRQEAPVGWARCYGGIIENADVFYPKAWAELQKEENAWLLKTEAEWLNMQANFPPDEFSELKGIGGVPYFVLNTEAKTLRLPDLRGLYAEASGFDGLEVGGVHGDAIRNITGKAALRQADVRFGEPEGALTSNLILNGARSAEDHQAAAVTGFDASRVVPTASKNQPRAFGVLPCVYLGR